MKAQRSIPVLIIAAGLLAYHNSFSGALVYDDPVFWANSPQVRELWSPWKILTHSWRPIVFLSFAMNYALGGLNPWGYHLFNVAVHILAGLTLYGVMRRTLISEWLAAAVALIWLVHPLQTESVTYIWQRCELLMGLFYLLTLYCVIRSTNSTRSLWWQAAAVVSCALGMASKEVMVTAPVVVMLYDRIFLAESWREVGQRRWTMYACLAATWLVLPFVEANALEVVRRNAGFEFKAYTPLQYALTQLGVILHYLRLAFWPEPLCLDYGWGFGWALAQRPADVLPGLLSVSGLLTATAWALWRKPALGFLGVWFFLILAPTSSFYSTSDLIVEHRMYLSLAAVVATVVIGVFALGNRLFSKRQKLGRLLGWGTCGIAVFSLTSGTIQRNLDYRSELLIWQDTVNKCPNNPRAHYNLGNALLNTGRFKEASAHWEQAVRIKPDYPAAQNNLAIAMAQSCKLKEAIDHWEQALMFEPGNPETQNNLAYALSQLGRVHEAIQHYEAAIRAKPDYVQAQVNLATLLAARPTAEGGDPVRALQLARAAGQTQLVTQIEHRLESYRAGRPDQQGTATGDTGNR